MFDTDAINAANPLPELVERLTGEPLRRSGDHKITHCPFHDERTPSFHVWDDHAHCYGCQVHISDSIGFIQKLKGIDFRQACEWLGGTPSVAYVAFVARPKVATTKQVEPLPDDFWHIERTARSAVYDSDEVKHRIGLEFGIGDRLVESLTFTQGAAIGFQTAPTYEAADGTRKSCHPDRIVYNYPSGIKIRHPFGAESKCRFLWEVGRPALPWRSFMLTRRGFPAIDTVHLMEGESDTIAALDAGLETSWDAPKPSCVIGSPGTSFKSEWAPLFAGKTVVLWFDDDHAGQLAADRVKEILRPVAREIVIGQFTPKEAA
ncbi:MAG: CHC2 zinc finger domain-containing protein [Verrucomicrobia bacterium]|nr:CHC2 zinc finger domain-containing protein [Verrucomicrobiota bacterium]